MTNTSATGGYLTPTSSVAAHDMAFVTFLQEVVVGITGLAGAMVRPRWQLIPAQQPEPTVDWASIGMVQERDLNLRGQTRHDPAGDGSDIFGRTVQSRIVISFYGPNAWGYAALFADGICVDQNRDALMSASVGLVSMSNRRALPELVNERWLMRVDIEIVFNREILRVYPIQSLLSAQGTIFANPPGESTVLETDYDTDWL